MSFERELSCLRGLLEKKYANSSNCGYTFIMSNGDTLPLTPAMMGQWSRAIVCRFPYQLQIAHLR